MEVKRMKKGVKRGKNRFDSKDDCTSTQFSRLKKLELENCFFIKVVYIFNRFHLTIYLPDSDIGPKSNGQNTKIVHRGAKNLVFGAIWVETPRCSKKMR